MTEHLAARAMHHRVRLLMMASGAYTLDQINKHAPGLADELVEIVREVESVERAAVVAYLRSHRIVCRLGSSHGLSADLADEIERGDHVAETSEPGGGAP